METLIKINTLNKNSLTVDKTPQLSFKIKQTWKKNAFDQKLQPNTEELEGMGHGNVSFILLLEEKKMTVIIGIIDSGGDFC